MASIFSAEFIQAFRRYAEGLGQRLSLAERYEQEVLSRYSCTPPVQGQACSELPPPLDSRNQVLVDVLEAPATCS